MKKVVWAGVCAGLVWLCAVRPAAALPPPEQLEELKAKADLIAVCKVGMVAANERRMQANMTVEMALVPSSFEAKRITVLFDRPPMDLRATEDDRPVVSKQTGGTGFPEPEGGETVLVFLQQAVKDRPGTYKVVCGTWGYIVLKTATAEEKEATIKKIEQYREYAKKIADEASRKMMDEVYQKVVDYLRK